MVFFPALSLTGIMFLSTTGHPSFHQQTPHYHLTTIFLGHPYQIGHFFRGGNGCPCIRNTPIDILPEIYKTVEGIVRKFFPTYLLTYTLICFVMLQGKR